jgi:myo-inositol-1(or 4)-monophosphatase
MFAPKRSSRNCFWRSFPTTRSCEEGNAENASTEFEWVIDPIDGTVNYFYGIPHFCISIALREKGEIIVGVIYDPMRDELWHAELGGKAYLNDNPIEVSQYTDISQSVVSVGISKTMAELEVDLSIFQDLLARARKCRMMGSAALDLAYVATGRFDAYIERSVNWWDIAAGVLWSDDTGDVRRIARRGQNRADGLVISPGGDRVHQDLHQGTLSRPGKSDSSGDESHNTIRVDLVGLKRSSS